MMPGPARSRQESSGDGLTESPQQTLSGVRIGGTGCPWPPRLLPDSRESTPRAATLLHHSDPAPPGTLAPRHTAETPALPCPDTAPARPGLSGIPEGRPPDPAKRPEAQPEIPECHRYPAGFPGHEY